MWRWTLLGCLLFSVMPSEGSSFSPIASVFWVNKNLTHPKASSAQCINNGKDRRWCAGKRGNKRGGGLENEFHNGASRLHHNAHPLSFLLCFAGARRMVYTSASLCVVLYYTLNYSPKNPFFFLVSLHCFVAHNVRESRVGRLTDQQK